MIGKAGAALIEGEEQTNLARFPFGISASLDHFQVVSCRPGIETEIKKTAEYPAVILLQLLLQCGAGGGKWNVVLPPKPHQLSKAVLLA